MKSAVLSMDVEDWYHLDYFDRTKCNTTVSLLDGLGVYSDFLAEQRLPSSFFVLSGLANQLKGKLRELVDAGHDVSSHGPDHVRPLTLSAGAFAESLCTSKAVLEDIVGCDVQGYRAPCFSLDKERLEQIREAGFKFDSSRILFSDHPLYGTIDMSGYASVSENIFRKDDFFEFQVSTLPLGGKHVPVSGGGYIRILPWWLMQRLISRYLLVNELYVLYVHPFELSRQPAPMDPHGTPFTSRIRFRLGRSTVLARLHALVDLLRKNGFEFTTFADLRQKLLTAD